MDFYLLSVHTAPVTALLFDTLRLSERLREEGHFTPEQAEALAAAFGEATRDDVLTKADLASLKTDICAVKAELRTEIADVKAALGTEIAEIKTALGTEIAEVKAEIAEAKAALKTEIAEVKAELGTVKAGIANLATKAEVADVKADILKWMVGAIGFQTVVMVGALVSLVRIFAK